MGLKFNDRGPNERMAEGDVRHTEKASEVREVEIKVMQLQLRKMSAATRARGDKNPRVFRVSIAQPPLIYRISGL